MKHKYSGLITLIDTTVNDTSICAPLRALLRQLLSSFDDYEADFDMIGNLFVYRCFYKEKVELCNTLCAIASRLEYQSLVFFEALCLLKPLTESQTTEFRDTVHLKNAGLVANSWYESLDFHFNRALSTKLEALPRYAHLGLRKHLRSVRAARKRFRTTYAPIRNNVLAHRFVTVQDYLEHDGNVLCGDYIRLLVQFLQDITGTTLQLQILAVECVERITRQRTRLAKTQTGRGKAVERLRQLTLCLGQSDPDQ